MRNQFWHVHVMQHYLSMCPLHHDLSFPYHTCHGQDLAIYYALFNPFSEIVINSFNDVYHYVIGFSNLWGDRVVLYDEIKYGLHALLGVSLRDWPCWSHVALDSLCKIIMPGIRLLNTQLRMDVKVWCHMMGSYFYYIYLISLCGVVVEQ